MSDRDIIVVVSAVLVVAQFLYRWWDRRDNKEVIAASAKDTKMLVTSIDLLKSEFSGVVKSFEPHTERCKSSHGMLKELTRIHRESDDTGRPFVYMPKELMDTQREFATILNVQTEILKVMNKDIIAIFNEVKEHKESCKSQFNQIDKQLAINKKEAS